MERPLTLAQEARISQLQAAIGALQEEAVELQEYVRGHPADADRAERRAAILRLEACGHLEVILTWRRDRVRNHLPER